MARLGWYLKGLHEYNLGHKKKAFESLDKSYDRFKKKYKRHDKGKLLSIFKGYLMDDEDFKPKISESEEWKLSVFAPASVLVDTPDKKLVKKVSRSSSPKKIRVAKSLAITAIILIFLVILLLASIPSSGNILCDETVIIEPGEDYVISVETSSRASIFFWNWNLISNTDHSVSFWMVDDKGTLYNNISVDVNSTVERGFYDVQREGKYQFVWSNQNNYGNVTIHVKELGEYGELGGGYGIILYVIGFIIMLMFYILINKRYQCKRNFDQKTISKKRYILMATVLLLCFLLLFTVPPFYYNDQLHEESISLPPLERYFERYDNFFEGDYIHWVHRIDDDAEGEKINFWIMDVEGNRYKYSTMFNNFTHEFGFVVPKDGVYYGVWDNMNNRTIDISYTLYTPMGNRLYGRLNIVFLMISFCSFSILISQI